MEIELAFIIEAEPTNRAMPSYRHLVSVHTCLLDGTGWTSITHHQVFDVHQDKETFLCEDTHELGVAASAVMGLIKTLKERSHIFMDRYFTILTTLENLLQKKIMEEGQQWNLNYYQQSLLQIKMFWKMASITLQKIPLIRARGGQN